MLRNMRNKKTRGNAIVEFALAASVMIPAIIGSAGVGMQLGRSIQVAQVSRDTCKMFFTGVDFSIANNQKLIGRLAYGMGLASSADGTINPTGNGLVILTRVQKVGAAQCQLGGYSSGNCPNKGALVIIKRVNIGNTSLTPSHFGNPSSMLLQGGGEVLAADFADEASLVVPSAAPTQHLNLADGQYTYVTESFFRMPSMAGFGGNQSYAFNMM